MFILNRLQPFVKLKGIKILKNLRNPHFYGKKISSTASTYSAYYPLRNVTLVSVEVYSDFEKLAAVGTVGSCISLLVNL